MNREINKADTFNSAFQVGERVTYTDDFRDMHETHTTSTAWALGSGDALVRVFGFSGGRDIGRVCKCNHSHELRVMAFEFIGDDDE